MYVCRLISTHGTDVIGFRTDKGIPLLCDAILKRCFDCAEILLEYARDWNAFVMIDTGKCVTLDYGKAQTSVAITKFVLDRVAAKQFTVDESCNILTNYLLPLTQTFPNLMLDYLKRDAFSFEYGRVMVPVTLFDNPDLPAVMTTDETLTDWTSLDSAAVKEFWSQNCEERRTALDGTSGVQVEAVAKFLCVNQLAVRQCWSDDTVGIASGLNDCRDRYHFLRSLSSLRDFPVEVFSSPSLQTFSAWVYESVYTRFYWFIFWEGFYTGYMLGIVFRHEAIQKKDSWMFSERADFSLCFLVWFLAQVYGYVIKRSWI